MSENFIYGNGTNRLYGVSDTIDSASSLTVASTKCVNNVYNNLKELIDSKGGGLPLGHIYLWPFSTPPDGSIQVNGDTYSRTLYSDLWNLVKTKGWYKSESEWQSIASANGGYCPWYSIGDGSTTFRTPKFAPYQKLALASGDAGKYYSAGLPNITGKSWSATWNGFTNVSYGAFYSTIENPSATAGSTINADYNNDWWNFDASRSNPIYGNSTTVTPESHDWIVCVVAFGTVTNVGEIDVASVISAVSQVQANPNLQGTAHLVETWKSTDGTSWYRKYSDGWIEQGGPMSTNENVTFHVAFSDTNYYVDVTWNGGKSEVFYPSDWYITKTSNTYFKTSATTNAHNVRGLCWYACGY